MLVTVEGIDGCGKSTLCAGLREQFPAAVMTREPTKRYASRLDRMRGDEATDPLEELAVYLADHLDHLDRIVRPALQRGKLVISDRYVDSRVAYQSVTLEGAVPDPVEFVSSLHRRSRQPDLTIYLAVDAATAVERSAGTDRFERVAFLERVREQYLSLIATEPARFVCVDGRAPPAVVLSRVVAVLSRALSYG